MIIDSHVYCFDPVDSPAGYATGEEHLRWVQRAHGSHHQPAFRIRDRQTGPSKPLNPEYAHDLHDLPDLHFRFDHETGRAVWNYEQEEYTKQFFPPNLRHGEYTPHSLIGEMDYVGVDLALIHTDPMLGRGDAYAAYLNACVQRYPDRLRSMVQVDEHLIAGAPDAVIESLHRAINGYGLHALKFCASIAYLAGTAPWDDGPYRPFWEAVMSLNIPVFFTLGSGPADISGYHSPEEGQRGYLDELSVLMRWMSRYPNTVCSLTHGFPYRLFLKEDRVVLPDEVWAPFRNPHCHMEVCFPVRLGDLFDFPYREIWPTLEAMADRIGSDRLLWGTDMPFQNRFCTYRQSRDWIEKYCTFLSRENLEWIMGKTAAKILGV